MPKSYTPRLLPFPKDNPTDTSDLICVKFKIPNRVEYRAAVRSALDQLGKFGVWEEDEYGTGTKIAAMFRELLYRTFEFEYCTTFAMTCDEIANCLNSPSVAAALGNALNPQSGSSVPQQVTIQNTTNVFNYNLNPPAENCNDAMFGAIRQFVNFINDLVIDFFEFLEASVVNNAIEFLDVVSRVTVIDESSADVVLNFVRWVVDNLLDAYQAASNVLLLDEIACDIFCQVKDTCALKLETFSDYLEREIGKEFLGPSGFQNVISLLNYIANVVIGVPDKRTVLLGMYAVVGIARFVDVLLRENLRVNINAAIKLYVQFKSYLDDPDNDWDELCECEPEPDTGKWMWLIGNWPAWTDADANGRCRYFINPTWQPSTQTVFTQVRISNVLGEGQVVSLIWRNQKNQNTGSRVKGRVFSLNIANKNQNTGAPLNRTVTIRYRVNQNDPLTIINVTTPYAFPPGEYWSIQIDNNNTNNSIALDITFKADHARESEGVRATNRNGQIFNLANI